MPENRVFETNEIFVADLNFNYYSMNKEDGDLIQGYYVKVVTNDVIFDSI